MTFRVAHLSDVHIRSLSRHDEVIEVVAAFCEDARRRRINTIVVAGDLWHHKCSSISPESVELMTWMLREFACVAPLHITLGNHDGVLANTSRQDAISPIVAAMRDNRIVLLKKSGSVLIAPKVSLSTFSVFDQAGWDAVVARQGHYNLACFHGPVAGAMTEAGWALDSKTSVDWFAERGFDVVMLGDIHKQQHLAYRDFDGVATPWISYCGSLLQNTYAEDLEHGYLVWDIDPVARKHSVEFVRLPNPKPFVTIEWAGSVEGTATAAAAWPNGSRFRVSSSYVLPSADASALAVELRDNKRATEVVFKADDTTLDAKLAAASLDVDVSSSESVARMLREYYESEIVEPETWKSMISALERVHSDTIVADDVERGTVWSLDRLEFDSLYGYGPGNSVDFSKMRGIVGVFGPNRVGKSSIVGSILYALFNSSDRDAGKNAHVVNVRSKCGSARASFAAGSTRYVADRTTTKVTSRGLLTANTTLSLRADDGSDMTGEQRADTEKTLRRLLGQPDDFLTTCVSAQDDTFRFLRAGPTKRKEVLARFLGIDVFEKLHARVSSEASERRSRLKGFPSTEELSERVRTHGARICEIAAASAARADRLASVESASREDAAVVSSLETKLSVSSAAVEAGYRRLRLDALRTQLADLTARAELAAADLAAAKARSAEAVSWDVMNAAREKLSEAKLALQEAAAAARAAASDLDRSKKISLKLADVPCGDAFPGCTYIRDAHEARSDLPTLTSERDRAAAALEAASVAVRGMDEGKFKHDLEARREADRAVAAAENAVASFSAQARSVERELESLSSQLGAILDASADDVEDIRRRLSATRSRLRELDSERASLTAEQRAADKEAGRLEAIVSESEERTSARAELDAELKTYELLANAFSKRGIPSALLNRLLPAVNAEMASMLDGVVDMRIRLHASDDTNALEVYVEDEAGSERPLELGSGMERMVASLVLRAALTSLTTLPKADFMIVDEGFGALDDEQAPACVSLLRALKARFRFIMVISHTDVIKDAVDAVVEISSGPDGARVVA